MVWHAANTLVALRFGIGARRLAREVESPVHPTVDRLRRPAVANGKLADRSGITAR